MLADSGTRVAVYGGELWVKHNGEQAKVKKGDELTLDNANRGALLAKDIQPDQSDDWNKQRVQYHDRYYTRSDYSSYPFYGQGDLSYYGGWYGPPGYGSLWQPYNVGLGWNPFGSAYWDWYPGFGYAWISGYPWGWLPYRYGSWVWVSGWGWGWTPGTQWDPWLAVPNVVNSPPGFPVPGVPNANRPIIKPVPVGPIAGGAGAPAAVIRPGIGVASAPTVRPPAAKPPAVQGSTGYLGRFTPHGEEAREEDFQAAPSHGTFSGQSGSVAGGMGHGGVGHGMSGSHR